MRRLSDKNFDYFEYYDKNTASIKKQKSIIIKNKEDKQVSNTHVNATVVTTPEQKRRKKQILNIKKALEKILNSKEERKMIVETPEIKQRKEEILYCKEILKQSFNNKDYKLDTAM